MNCATVCRHVPNTSPFVDGDNNSVFIPIFEITQHSLKVLMQQLCTYKKNIFFRFQRAPKDAHAGWLMDLSRRECLEELTGTCTSHTPKESNYNQSNESITDCLAPLDKKSIK